MHHTADLLRVQDWDPIVRDMWSKRRHTLLKLLPVEEWQVNVSCDILAKFEASCSLLCVVSCHTDVTQNGAYSHF